MSVVSAKVDLIKHIQHQLTIQANLFLPCLNKNRVWPEFGQDVLFGSRGGIRLTGYQSVYFMVWAF